MRGSVSTADPQICSDHGGRRGFEFPQNGIAMGRPFRCWMVERFDDSAHNEEGGIAEEASSADNLVQVAVESPVLNFFMEGTVTSKVRPEARRVGSKQFPRWVIIDDAAKVPSQRKFWNGEGWVEGLRNAMLFAHKHAVLEELERAKGE